MRYGEWFIPIEISQRLELCCQSSKNLYCGRSGFRGLSCWRWESSLWWELVYLWHLWLSIWLILMRGGNHGWDISNKVKDTKLFLPGTDKIHLVLVFWFPNYMNINFSKMFQPLSALYHDTEGSWNILELRLHGKIWKCCFMLQRQYWKELYI